MADEFWDCTNWTESKNGKNVPTRLGYAKKRDDGGFFVTLTGLPVDGKFTIAPRKPKGDDDGPGF